MIAQSSRQITAQDEAEDSQVQSRIGLYLGLRIYSLMKKKIWHVIYYWNSNDSTYKISSKIQEYTDKINLDIRQWYAQFKL